MSERTYSGMPASELRELCDAVPDTAVGARAGSQLITFSSAAQVAIPELLDEVARLRAALSEARDIATDGEPICGYCAEIEALARRALEAAND